MLVFKLCACHDKYILSEHAGLPPFLKSRGCSSPACRASSSTAGAGSEEHAVWCAATVWVLLVEDTQRQPECSHSPVAYWIRDEDSLQPLQAIDLTTCKDRDIINFQSPKVTCRCHISLGQRGEEGESGGRNGCMRTVVRGEGPSAPPVRKGRPASPQSHTCTFK